MQERWLEAASLARSAIHISPENARGYASLAHSLYEQVDKRRKAAQPKYDGTAKSDNPYVPDGELGMMAIEAGEAASTLNPADAPTRYRTGRLLRRVPGAQTRAQVNDHVIFLTGCFHSHAPPSSYCTLWTIGIPYIPISQNASHQRLSCTHPCPNGVQNRPDF